MSGVPGTQWEESDQASAQILWENIEREEEPALLANLGQWAGLFLVFRTLVYMCGGTIGFLLRIKVEIWGGGGGVPGDDV